MISQETLEEIKKSVRLVDVVGKTMSLTRRGNNFSGLCPFHSEKTPSFNINEVDNFYHCFGCGASGNVISWFMQYEGLSFPDAVKAIGERYGIEIKEEGGRQRNKPRVDVKPIYNLNSLASKYYKHCLQTAPSEIQEYLEARGLTDDVVDYFGIGFVPDEWRSLTDFCRNRKISDDLLVKSGLARRNSKGELYDTFRGRVMFPVMVDGRRIAGFGGRVVPNLNENSKTAPKYINSPETPVYRKSNILYGLPQALSSIRESKEVVLVEGYMDVIGLHKVGVTNSVAACGTALTEEHVRRLKSLANKVLLLFDGDSAGRTAASKCFITFINSGIDARVLFLDADQDPDTIAKLHGEQTYQYLSEQKTRPLLNCWIEHLVTQNGFGEISELGAAAKGKIATAIADVLRTVENKIEQDELLRSSSFLLKTNLDEFSSLVSQNSSSSFSSTTPAKEANVFQDQDSEVFSIPEINELKVIERDLLYAVMAKRDSLPGVVLSEPLLIEEIHPAVIAFVQDLSDTLSEEEGDKKEAIKVLLKSYGNSWVQHWKQSYQLVEDKAVMPEEIVKGCLESLKRERIKKTLRAVDEQIENCSDEAMRAELVKRKIEMLKSRSQSTP